MYIVVGLGNPGLKYKNTNHNVGFMVLDKLADKLNLSFNSKGFQGEYAQTIIGTNKVILLKPSTFMNLSGNSVSEIVNFYKVPTQNLIVVYDDIDVDVGKIRIRQKGSAGTHNGMRSIISCLGGSQDFPRVRVGTKSQYPMGNLVDFVLSDIRKEDKPFVEDAISKSVNACIDFISGESIEKIMSKYNG